jgi:hypothetical protein
MKDSLMLMNIYRHYLSITSKLIEILERNMKKSSGNVSPELKCKYKEFQKHAHILIESFNDDLHKLTRLDYELKELEEKEEQE